MPMHAAVNCVHLAPLLSRHYGLRLMQLFIKFIAGGTNNSSFNGRTTNWQKVKRIKARVAKKRSGAKSKHLNTAVEGVSGKRTGKSQRKSQRKEKLRQKEQQSLESGMDVDGEKKPVKNLAKALKKTGSGKKIVRKMMGKTEGEVDAMTD